MISWYIVDIIHLLIIKSTSLACAVGYTAWQRKLKTGYNAYQDVVTLLLTRIGSSSSHTSLINNLGWLKKETSESPHKINMQTSRGKEKKKQKENLKNTSWGRRRQWRNWTLQCFQTCICSLSSNSTKSFPIPRTTMYGVRSQSYCTNGWATTSNNNYQLLQQIGKETNSPS
jgi:hypothetical protein